MKEFVHLILLSALLPLSAFGQRVPADLVLLNGKVFTADVAKPFAEAVAISGERIIAVMGPASSNTCTIKTRTP